MSVQQYRRPAGNGHNKQQLDLIGGMMHIFVPDFFFWCACNLKAKCTNIPDADCSWVVDAVLGSLEALGHGATSLPPPAQSEACIWLQVALARSTNT